MARRRLDNLQRVITDERCQLHPPTGGQISQIKASTYCKGNARLAPDGNLPYKTHPSFVSEKYLKIVAGMVKFVI